MVTLIDEWRRKFPSCMVVKRLIIRESYLDEEGEVITMLVVLADNRSQRVWRQVDIYSALQSQKAVFVHL